MSKDIETAMTNHTATEFWGGADRGVCLQVNASAPMRIHDDPLDQVQEEGYILLTMEEAAALHATLAGFVRREAVRRQALLREHLELLKIEERTVFHEVLALKLCEPLSDELVITMVSRFCPKAPISPSHCQSTEGGVE